MAVQWRAELKATAFKPEQFPLSELPEIALAGRSNVGKSSLLNRLAGQKLAHVSSAPGRTRSVNFFQMTAQNPFMLVDLPGFGYAARGREERNAWAGLIERYATRREQLALVVHLIDIRHGMLKKDEELQMWLKELEIPVLAVFTKADKIARAKRKALIMQYVRQGIYSWTLPLAVSVEEPGTIDAFKAQLDQYLEQLLSQE